MIIFQIIILIPPPSNLNTHPTSLTQYMVLLQHPRNGAPSRILGAETGLTALPFQLRRRCYWSM